MGCVELNPSIFGTRRHVGPQIGLEWKAMLCSNLAHLSTKLAPLGKGHILRTYKNVASLPHKMNKKSLLELVVRQSSVDDILTLTDKGHHNLWIQ